MQKETLAFKFGDEDGADLLSKIFLLEVTTETERSDSFSLRLSTEKKGGSWSFVDEPRFALWSKVEVGAGFGGSVDPLFTGYITWSGVSLLEEGAEFVVRGLDETVLMDRTRVQKAWPGKKDSDIVKEIFQSYGFKEGDVEDTEVVHEEAVSTIMQRETDLQFIRRLARRNGFETRVRNGLYYFRSPDLRSDSQPVLAAQFGSETNLFSFRASADALSPGEVVMHMLDRNDKTVREVVGAKEPLKPMGASGVSALGGETVKEGLSFVARQPVAYPREMELLADSLKLQEEWFVRAEGEVNANQYGHVLESGRTVVFKGVGERFSGTYYVVRVNHQFRQSAYSQSYLARRNALVARQSDDFQSGEGN